MKTLKRIFHWLEWYMPNENGQCTYCGGKLLDSSGGLFHIVPPIFKVNK